MPIPGVEIRPERVRQARQDAGLSMAGLAHGAVSKTTIHLIEAGRMRPSHRVLEMIAKRTEKPVEYFLPQGAPRSGPARTSDKPTGIFSENVNAALSEVRQLVATRQLTGAERIALESVMVNLRLGRRVFGAIVRDNQLVRKHSRSGHIHQAP